MQWSLFPATFYRMSYYITQSAIRFSEISSAIFMRSKQLYNCLCLSVHLSVCNSFFIRFHSPDLHKNDTRHLSYKIIVACMFSDQEVKGQGHTGHTIFLCLLYGSMPMWQIRFIFAINITHEATLCCTSYQSQRIKSWGCTGYFKLRSHGLFEVFVCVRCVALCLFDQFASCVANLHLMRWQCVVHHFWAYRSKSGFHGLFEVFVVCTMALCL